jgi:hypothetical protein
MKQLQHIQFKISDPHREQTPCMVRITLVKEVTEMNWITSHEQLLTFYWSQNDYKQQNFYIPQYDTENGAKILE